jgi:hypothetical protein
MDIDKVLDLVILVLGKENVSRIQRRRLKTLLEMTAKTNFHENDYTKKESKAVPDKVQGTPNEIKTEENNFDLASAPHFDFPKGVFNLEVEGEEGVRKIKILPDGTEEK